MFVYGSLTNAIRFTLFVGFPWLSVGTFDFFFVFAVNEDIYHDIYNHTKIRLWVKVHYLHEQIWITMWVFLSPEFTFF